MSQLQKLKQCTNRIDLAVLLRIKPFKLSHVLYVETNVDKYKQFSIPKKSGGTRLISAPQGALGWVQKSLSDLLLDCIDEINSSRVKPSSLSHGFVRERSIITNANLHRNQRNVLNIDLENFFESFNFGRVRGFFIKNNHFKLHEDVATVIAQIACFNNSLPQGSPCSPVITNLITHSLDITLARMAKKYSCTYSRYADDITFSTRKKTFPQEIMEYQSGLYSPSPRLEREIKRAGFSINGKKTRIQFCDSRQDVTGLIVNKKLGVSNEYRRLTKAMCHWLFTTGEFFIQVNEEVAKGSLNYLEGRLNFIDSIDKHNRVNHPITLSKHYTHRNHGLRTRELWSSREKLLSKFLFYKYFYANEKVAVLCEGKTDNIYLKCAINSLKAKFPILSNVVNENKPLEFINYNKRTRFLLELAGGTSYLKGFIDSYAERYSAYAAPTSLKPVIVLADNDSGINEILNSLSGMKGIQIYPAPATKGVDKQKLKKAQFIHVGHNLYVVLTPLNAFGEDTMIEDMFQKVTLDTKLAGRSFDPTEKLNPKSNYYGKNDFATQVIQKYSGNITFSGFDPLLNRIKLVIEHYDSIK